MLPAGHGGFRNGETSMSYLQLAVWLVHLGLVPGQSKTDGKIR